MVTLPSSKDFQEHILLHNSAAPPVGLSRSFPGLMPHNLSAVRSPGYAPALGDPLPLPPLPADNEERTTPSWARPTAPCTPALTAAPRTPTWTV
ncbi:hypothetical protein WMY93_031975 [Mugilogobius chulae]|uniref:Uncharacterized protein n=1 Tax=Mugilogobius chulae TaxID=88201 RepID=A0AAW0MDD0_9GOBI